MYNIENNLIAIIKLVPSTFKLKEENNLGSLDYVDITYHHAKDLFVCELYQRLLNQGFITKQESFNPKLARPLVVFKRPNGQLVVVDGQHTTVLGIVYESINVLLPCQVHIHDKNLSAVECQKIEAHWFSLLNGRRRPTSIIDNLRVDIEMEKPDALSIEKKLVELNVRIENLGSKNGYEVKGYAMIKRAWEKYNMSCVEKSIILYNTLNTNKKYESWKDDKKLKGSLILGFSAVYYLLDRFLGNGDKSYALNTYLKKYLGNTSPSELESKTAGNLQDVLIARRVIDKCNTLIENKLLKKENGDLFKNKVGEEILEKASLGDPSK